jgi:GntR family transcriptional repressor for pyruvate dehydrogenase complex
MSAPQGRESDLRFSSIRRAPAAAGEVIATIKGMILDGQLGPHQRLPSEKDLAERLGVSRPTIREAVRGLMSLNIVESRHGDGTYVTSLEPSLLAAPIDFLLRVDDQGLQALTEVRSVLESGAAEMAATKATAANIARFRELVEEYGASIGDVETCIRLDIAFHEEVARAADSPLLMSLLATVTALGRRSRERTAQSRQMRYFAHQDHEAIAAAIAAHDPEAARAAMHGHLTHVQKSSNRARKATASRRAT